MYLYTRMGGRTVTARINTDKEPAVEEAHILDVDMERTHFFDLATEQTIV
jgi:hypothetical protein